jgi:hypothetical protein
MKTKNICLSVLCAGLFAASAVTAAPIPYANKGKVNTETYKFTAVGKGDVVAYYVGATAGYTNTISLLVNGIDKGIAGLVNHDFDGVKESKYGQSLNFGSVKKGDSLVFKLNANLTAGAGAHTLFSDPSMNTKDGNLNHIYSSAYAGDVTLKAGAFGLIPKGTYVGFEDLIGGGDLDYDDEQFVFTNIGVNVPTVAKTPIPGAVWLFGTGIAGLIGLGRKRGQKMAA